jgi:tetratricopeptide (TPR) repeat protein
MLHAEGSLAGAEAHYREALRREPASAIAWYNLGVLLEDQSQQDEALDAYERAVRADPQLADAHYNLALLYEREGRERDAVRHLAIYRRLSPRR